MPTRCTIFWDGYAWALADQATDTELASGFADIHAAFQDADARGLRVVDVMTTRGHVKPKRPELNTTGVA